MTLKMPPKELSTEKSPFATAHETLRHFGFKNLTSILDLDGYLETVMPQIPIEVVAGIAAQIPIEVKADIAIGRAYQLLEMAAAARQAISQKLPYGVGTNLLALQWAISEQELPRLRKKREEICQNQPDIRKAGPIVQYQNAPYYNYNKALKSLMPKVQLVLEREQRFIEWCSDTMGITEKKANVAVQGWKGIKLIPAFVYLSASKNWLYWWKDNISSTRSKANKRAGETVWHPEQKIEKLPGGGVRLTLPFDEPTYLELKPWILSWGPSARVIGPRELKDQVVSDIRKMADFI
jgi:hypothetical protein